MRLEPPFRFQPSSYTAMVMEKVVVAVVLVDFEAVEVM